MVVIIKETIKHLLIILILSLISKGIFASQGTPQKAANCNPASAKVDLDINNVRALIMNGGTMWWDLNENPKYEIPKGSGKSSMFCTSLWIAGEDINGQLRCAAQRYGSSGVDFWPGPLTTDGKASIDAETCAEYDNIFVSYKADVQKFIAWRSGLLDNFEIPKYFYDYPAHGDISKNQSKYLAPFYDQNADGEYNPDDGDYPYYDLENELCGNQGIPTAEGNGLLTDQVLKGDQTLWWVFNDKGGVHTESGGQAIGLEIRAQAFAFATNDEINNVTFYSYEIINRSTSDLTNTYFSQWIDVDLGYSQDDFVGCDVSRGLGYCYNGEAIDGSGREEDYGENPPAIGLDFFQGPYINADGYDNPKFEGTKIDGPSFEGNCDIIILDKNIALMDYIKNDSLITDSFIVLAEAINGSNFGDGIIDNERSGMRHFILHHSYGKGAGHPNSAIQYYNVLRGRWISGSKMQYGGNGYSNSGSYGPECDFMFPGETDICDWGTKGIKPNPKNWTEETAANIPADRYFMQSTGPFTLKAGAVNYITLGIPWAKASSGGPLASVHLLRSVDDMCQTLFDNCFRVLDGPSGPNAPDMTIRELDKEFIIFLSNPDYSNNKNESYSELDHSIAEMSVTYIDTNSLDTVYFDRYYRFEGYQIFQLENPDVSISEIENIDKSRLVAQCDIKNNHSTIINFEFDETLNASVPIMKVEGENEGVVHSFQIKQDLFAVNDKSLVNNKQYYYTAIAYSKNEYMKYSQFPIEQIPGIIGLEGQTLVYLAGSKSADGSSIPVITAIPHITNTEGYGTILNTEYGFQPKITRIEGQGNGGNIIDYTLNSYNAFLNSSTCRIDHPTFENGKGPIEVKIIDPLNLVNDSFLVKFQIPVDGNIDEANWWLINANTPSIVYGKSDNTIETENEQIFTNLGFSVSIKQYQREALYKKINGITPSEQSSLDKILVKFEILDASIEYEDSRDKWLMGLSDVDGSSYLDWIRAGSVDNGWHTEECDKYFSIDGYNKYSIDPDEVFENILEGTWAPYTLCSDLEHGPGRAGQVGYDNPGATWYNPLTELASVDIVFTDDKSKWTRCPIIEMCEESALSEGNANKWDLRKAQSVGKDGNPDGSGTGMGWFPGYVINIETGERLCVIFGEDSWLVGENGKDMLFNPTFSYSDLSNILIGGKHWLYVLKHKNYDPDVPTEYDIPAYTGEASADTIKERVSDAPKLLNGIRFFQSIMWVGMPMPNYGNSFLENGNDARVRIRIAKPYERYFCTNNDTAINQINNNYPTFAFSTKGLSPINNDLGTAISALDYINVVPNPYYAYSSYNKDQLDDRIRITNLPTKCTVSIYTINGTLIKQFKVDKSGIPELRNTKSSNSEDFEFKTSIDWDLKNNFDRPISGGVYLIHVKAEGVGERIIKWFGILP